MTQLLDLKNKIINSIKEEFKSNKTSKIFDSCVRRYMNPGSNPGGKSTSSKLYINRGDLVKSLQRGDPSNIWEVSNDSGEISLVIGSTLPYANVHEYGFKNIPKRPYLNPAIDLFNRKYLQDIIDNAFKKI